jgi:hypothetical protein
MKNITSQNVKKNGNEFPRSLDEKLMDVEQSYRCLKLGDIKGETGSTIVAAQDQALSTNYSSSVALQFLKYLGHLLF